MKSENSSASDGGSCCIEQSRLVGCSSIRASCHSRMLRASQSFSILGIRAWISENCSTGAVSCRRLKSRSVMTQLYTSLMTFISICSRVSCSSIPIHALQMEPCIPLKFWSWKRRTSRKSGELRFQSTRVFEHLCMSTQTTLVMLEHLQPSTCRADPWRCPSDTC